MQRLILVALLATALTACNVQDVVNLPTQEEVQECAKLKASKRNEVGEVILQPANEKACDRIDRLQNVVENATN
jgi:hypothetical protein